MNKAKVFKSVIIEKDSLGNVIKVLEMSVLDSTTISELKRQAQVNVERLEKEKAELILAKDKAKKELEGKLADISIMLAKLQFDSFVELGKSETTKEFEQMFNDYLIGGTFNIEVAPVDFLKILGRVK